ncbi:hypothetical protein BDL97_06G084600 [Sphagnum fallax]|nr:hypothetical protein BDL97_06G084600 [Sphagnum fallax]
MAECWSLNPTSPTYSCNPGLSQLRHYLLRTRSFSSANFFVAAQGRLVVFKEATCWVSSPPGLVLQRKKKNMTMGCSLGARASSSDSSSDASPCLLRPTVSVMVNGCTGKMGQAVAEAAIAAGLQLVPKCITGRGRAGGCAEFSIQGIKVDVVDGDEREKVMDQVLQDYPDLIVVDYTLPAAVNGNAEFYCSRGLPFVMGTTGGDRNKLVKDVEASGVYAVIAPQMGKQVVAFQAAMELMAEQFPGAFAGYTLQVTESHQSSKVDTSGTAKAVISSFQKLGLPFNLDQIEMVRDPEEQVTRMGVPSEHLDGHAFHTYQLVSADGMVVFEFQHNVCGRSIYAQGTVDAVLFLAKKIREKADKKLYNMIDVLREGNMR